MTRPSIDCGIASQVGSIVPLRNARMPPASPAKVPAIVKASHWWVRMSMPIASARSGEVAAGAQGHAEGREDDVPQQKQCDDVQS